MGVLNRDAIAVQVRAAMRTFEAAERDVDAERLIAHFAPVPDFHVYNDGCRLDYQTLTTNIRAGFPTLRGIEGGFEEIHIFVLAPDAALATASFREKATTITNASTRVRGAASWLWCRMDGEWRIVYGHADHYPDE